MNFTAVLFMKFLFFVPVRWLVLQLFKGMLYYCDGPDVSDVRNKTDCYDKGPPYRWVNRKYNFDNLGQVPRRTFIMNFVHRCVHR